jgi:hypothetical protein
MHSRVPRHPATRGDNGQEQMWLEPRALIGRSDACPTDASAAHSDGGQRLYPRNVAPTVVSTAQKLGDESLRHTRRLKRQTDVTMDCEPQPVRVGQEKSNVEQAHPKVGPKGASLCGIAS